MNKLSIASLAVAGICAASVKAEVSAFSRANCYVSIADIGWESVTWGWPSSRRATSSWHNVVGAPGSSAHNIHDNFSETWRSFAGDSHGLLGDKYEVRGKHWGSQHETFIGIYNYKNSYAIDCNLSQW